MKNHRLHRLELKDEMNIHKLHRLELKDEMNIRRWELLGVVPSGGVRRFTQIKNENPPLVGQSQTDKGEGDHQSVQVKQHDVLKQRPGRF